MKILGIETSCDDTAVAVVENGRKTVAEAVVRQTEIHQQFGGVVPEVASREHLSFLFPLIEEVMQKAKAVPSDIGLLAATIGPGLKGSLLVGVQTASTLSYLWKKKVVPINHLQAHLFASLLDTDRKWHFPLLGLVVSGGHTSLALVKSYDDFKVLGETRDDAAGEALDKIAKLLGLGYPGGPIIDREAAKVKRKIRPFLPRPMIESRDFDFSFSGLKTAVKYILRRKKKDEIIFDAQEAIVDVLVNKLAEAYQKFQPKQIIVGGGVIANSRLRTKILETLGDKTEVILPKPCHSLDNAAMVAGAAYFLRERAVEWYNLKVKSDLAFAKI